jgi:hypothetical protein
MNVLVTGATGFVGRPLCEKLLTTFGLVRGAIWVAEPAVNLPAGVQATPIQAIGHATDWSEALVGIDTVIHSVARHLGTEHTELHVTPAPALAVIPRLPTLYDEPFSDSSQIPTYLVSQLARQHVTVSLPGDAGNELFCGYNRYQLTDKLWGILSAVPALLRRLAAKGLTSVSPQAWNRMARGVGGLLPRSAQVAYVGDKLHKGGTY